jgi:hypothetical protein
MLVPPSTGRVVSRLTAPEPRAPKTRRRRRRGWRAPQITLSVAPIRRRLQLRMRRLRTR